MITILIVEDDPSVLDNIRDILTLEDYRILTATNGREGIEQALAHIPDLIICDVMMPEVDGYGVIQTLRQNEKTCNIPFIFLTAKADRFDQREGMEAGADDYLTKPFRPQEVIKAVKTRLARHHSLMQPYQVEKERTKTLAQQLQENQELAEIKANLLTKLAEDLREPLGNVNLALHLLGRAKTEGERERYLAVLREEYAREVKMLQNVSNLQNIITPDNIKVLRQFNLLRS